MTNFNPVLYPITETITVDIPNGQSASSVVDMQDFSMVGLIIPIAFTGTTITFNGSHDNINFYPLYNTAGTQLSITVGPDRWVEFSPGDFAGVRFLSFVTGSLQAQNTILTVVVRSLM